MNMNTGPGNTPDTDVASCVTFLLRTVTSKTSLPLSYKIPAGYWATTHVTGSKPLQNSPNDRVQGEEEMQAERVLASGGLNIYDGAVRAIAVALTSSTSLLKSKQMQASHSQDPSGFVNMLLSGRCGDLANIRASGNDFRYGERKQPAPVADQAYFFRMVSDTWMHSDSLSGKQVQWMDWKPITGENAWAGLIAPVQVSALRNE